MKIYTRTGDDGTTGIFAGPRLKKNDIRIEAFGTVDELNAVLGIVRSNFTDVDLDCQLQRIQNSLFAIGATLATWDISSLEVDLVSDTDIEELETWIDGLDDEVPALRNFILPGGGLAAATIHLARTVSRRAERRVVSLCEEKPEEAYWKIVVFLNRLSDYLFVLSRVVNQRHGYSETVWQGRNA